MFVRYPHSHTYTYAHSMLAEKETNDRNIRFIENMIQLD